MGGDRIESAIIKFVPETSGLCKFAIDRVDYVINGTEVNQTIDSSVEVEYPIYKDINITYTPITISKYENTGDGVYLSFDNEDGYTVFKVNESDDFVTVDSGRIFTKDISITSIEYGYADYGHTTQSCDFKNDYWNGDIHNVTALKRIYTVEDFFAMTDGYYLLMNDLDLRSVQTKAQIKLTGIFDANGHTIRGLSNVVDTSKYEYFDLFQGGSIYDATFKELYVSVNHTSNGNSLYVRPLGNAKLFNCMVKGDVMLSDSANYGDLNIADDSTTYSLNVTIGTAMSTQKHTAANTLAKIRILSNAMTCSISTVKSAKRFCRMPTETRQTTPLRTALSLCAVVHLPTVKHSGTSLCPKVYSVQAITMQEITLFLKIAL